MSSGGHTRRGFGADCHVVFGSAKDAKWAVKQNGVDLHNRPMKIDGAADGGKREADVMAAVGKVKWQAPAAPAANPTSEIRCFIGNLEFSLGKEAELKTAFAEIGAEVKDAYIPTDRVTQKFYGTAFVNFVSAEAAATAVGCNGMLLRGRPTRVEFSPYKIGKNRAPNSSGGKGGGGGKGKGKGGKGKGGGKGGGGDFSQSKSFGGGDHSAASNFGGGGGFGSWGGGESW